MNKNNKKISAIFALIFLFAVIGIVSGKNSDVTQISQAQQNAGLVLPASKSTSVKSTAAPRENKSQNEVATKRTPSSADLSADELASLAKMTLTLFNFTQADSRLQDLLQFLEGSGQKPVVVNNTNADTGEMAIVRTGSPLPGTRYFHAQYFSDAGENGFVQHMSFELKSGPGAMTSAEVAVQNNFPNLPNPKRRTADYIQWDLPNGQILWIKKLAAIDLKDNPFNAYTAGDVGTIRVAVELEIHDDQASHSH